MRSDKTRRKIQFRSLNLCLAIFFGTLILILYVGKQVYIISLEKRVHELINEKSELDDHLKNLKIEFAGLRKGSRIKKIAHECLGMSLPEGAPEKLF